MWQAVRASFDRNQKQLIVGNILGDLLQRVLVLGCGAESTGN